MEIEKIYSEKAEEDIWSSLLKFTYTENLKRFFIRLVLMTKKNGL